MRGRQPLQLASIDRHSRLTDEDLGNLGQDLLTQDNQVRPSLLDNRIPLSVLSITVLCSQATPMHLLLRGGRRCSSR